MKLRISLAILVLAAGSAACQSLPPRDEPPSGPSRPEVACRAHLLDRWLGALPTQSVKAEIAARVGDRPIRYFTVGDPITMDFNPQRLNVELRSDGRIGRFWCG